MRKLLGLLIAVGALMVLNVADAEARGSCFCSYKYGSQNYSPETRGGDEPRGGRKAGKCLEICKDRRPHANAWNAALRAAKFNANTCKKDAKARFAVKARVTGTKQANISEDYKTYVLRKCKTCPSGYHRTPRTSVNAKNACRRIQYTSAR